MKLPDYPDPCRASSRAAMVSSNVDCLIERSPTVRREVFEVEP